MNAREGAAFRRHRGFVATPGWRKTADVYQPPFFVEDDPREVSAMMARAGLALLVTHGEAGLFATHLPMLMDADRGVLEGHVARANPQPARAGDEALVVFGGPHAYVSPSFYPSKADHGRHVPTWNYEAVHVTGRLSWFHEPERLRGLLERLTAAHELGREHPWSLDDAPPDYIDGLLRGIVGVEVTVDRIEATRKLSQNRDARDRQGVIDGLRADGNGAFAALMSALEPA